ncbi:MAG: MMPL family transporter [Desulfatirhabdiaceae bacterium]|nr:MMPL family transporter [Desulfatirhabdiaceae bacterium]
MNDSNAMPFTKPFGALYTLLSPRRKILYCTTLLVVVLGALAMALTDIHEDIQFMIPDRDAAVGEEFSLLQDSPFSKKVVINISGGADLGQLMAAADVLAGSMKPPYFTRVATGPGNLFGAQFFSWMLSAIPSLLSDDNFEKLSAKVTPEQIRERMRAMYQELATPEGWMKKELFRNDPLNLSGLLFEQLRFANLLSGMRIENQHFVSQDRKNVLIIAETPVNGTDSRGSAALMAQLDGLILASVPRPIEAFVMAAHRYTATNANAVKQDVFVVMCSSFLGIVVIIALFLLSWAGLFVLLVPVLALSVAGITGLFYDHFSAITIGFGSVLLGVTIDFAVHVYFALPDNESKKAAVLDEVTIPIVFGALTTVACFAVLLFSPLPGLRQVSSFSIVGICAALLISLITFPHFIGISSRRGVFLKKASGTRPRKFGMVTVLFWACLMLLCVWKAQGITFDGDMRSLNLTTPELKADEAYFQKTWGGGGTAMLFAEGIDLDQALEVNDRLFAQLKRRLPADQIVSISSLLPSASRQRVRQARWQDFWSRESVAQVNALMKQEGEAAGFSQDAFTPFFDGIGRQAPLVTADLLRAKSLGDMIDGMIVQKNGAVRVLTLVPDNAEVFELYQSDLKNIQGVRFVSQTHFGDHLSHIMGKDLYRMILGAVILNFALLYLLYRNFINALLAMVPGVTGVFVVMGFMGWRGIPLNIFHILSAILIVGLAVDYGIFIVCKLTGGHTHETEKAVMVSGLTTMAGFGALVLARHPAMHSIGVAVMLGVGAAIPATLFVIPALFGMIQGSRQKT